MYVSSSLSSGSNDNECLVWNNCQLSYIEQDVRRIPSTFEKIYGPKALKLDLSFNMIDSLEGIESFTSLQELVLDNNLLDDNTKFHSNPLLHTLSLNKNKFTDLEKLLNQLSEKYPNLKFLSLLGNSACPDQLTNNDKDEEDYKRYRRYVIHKLPHLKFLDSTKVKNDERKDAFERGKYFKIIRPNDHLFEDNNDRHGIREIFTPLPSANNSTRSHSGAFGRLKHRYTGKHSEGNRFIRNHEL